MRFALCLTQEHNLWLVGLAAVICLLGSHITFRLLQRLRHAEEGTRVAWTFMGAVATGAVPLGDEVADLARLGAAAAETLARAVAIGVHAATRLPCLDLPAWQDLYGKE